MRGYDTSIAVAQRHGNTFLSTTRKVRKLLAAARGSVRAMSASMPNTVMFWHRSLGDLSWQSLRRLWNAVGSGITFTDSELNAACVVPCHGCLKHRMTKPRVYTQCRPLSVKPRNQFQHVQTDIMVNRDNEWRKIQVCPCFRMRFYACRCWGTECNRSERRFHTLRFSETTFAHLRCESCVSLLHSISITMLS